jgi:2-keto-4-pentenoate hydratase/2-oxohepta-3-ene-1,7-dioic acid hydratase in catechol pathway
MKLASYIADGNARFGVVKDTGVVTMNDRLGGRFADLRSVLDAGALDAVAAAAADAEADRDLADISFLPLIPNPAKIICAGVNYRAHASEVGRDVPKQPSMFARFVDTLVGHDGDLVRPSISECFDFEGELALVIGKGGRHIAPEDALSHVAGYTCFMDGSVRDYQKFSVTSGKNFPGTGPLGPWMATVDEIPDPARLELTTRLNGVVVQHAHTDALIYAVPTLIAFCSAFTPLAPGDIIATGTPEGVGMRRSPPLWLKAGDMLEVEISGIGILRNRVVDQA